MIPNNGGDTLPIFIDMSSFPTKTDVTLTIRLASSTTFATF